MRLVEIRLLEGPNVYRLEPVVKLEVAIGRRRSWYGRREPGARMRSSGSARSSRRASGRPRSRAWSPGSGDSGSSVGDGRAGSTVHRSSDPGHWIVTWPWTEADRAQEIADAAVSLAGPKCRRPARARLTARKRADLGAGPAAVAEAHGRAPALDPGHRAADPDRLDQRHEREEHRRRG